MGEDLPARLDRPVRERELEVLGEELLEVRAADEVGVGDLSNLEDLRVVSDCHVVHATTIR